VAVTLQVVDSNPYSRLMALQRMGIVKDYERIRDKTVRDVWLKPESRLQRQTACCSPILQAEAATCDVLRTGNMLD